MKNKAKVIRQLVSVLVLATLLIHTSCRKPEDTPEPDFEDFSDDTTSTKEMSIKSISPDAAMEGDNITIKGSLLDGITSVTFNGTTASIISNTASELIIAVPNGASSGKLTITSANGSIQSEETITIIKEYIITTFEDKSTDKILNSAWWDYSDGGDTWSFNKAASTSPYEGSKYMHFAGSDVNSSYWVGGAGQNNGDATDASFGYPTLDITNLYLNIYLKTNGKTAVDIKLRETDGDIHKKAGLAPTSNGVWQRVSVALDASWNASEGTGNKIMNTNLINGIAIDIITKDNAGLDVDADVDRITITSGGPTTK